jgi:hypothetical protein
MASMTDIVSRSIWTAALYAPEASCERDLWSRTRPISRLHKRGRAGTSCLDKKSGPRNRQMSSSRSRRLRLNILLKDRDKLGGFFGSAELQVGVNQPVQRMISADSFVARGFH